MSHPFAEPSRAGGHPPRVSERGASDSERRRGEGDENGGRSRGRARRGGARGALWVRRYRCQYGGDQDCGRYIARPSGRIPRRDDLRAMRAWGASHRMMAFGHGRGAPRRAAVQSHRQGSNRQDHDSGEKNARRPHHPAQSNTQPAPRNQGRHRFGCLEIEVLEGNSGPHAGVPHGEFCLR